MNNNDIDILIVLSHMGSGGAQRVVTKLISEWKKNRIKVALLIGNGIIDPVYEIPSDIVVIEHTRHIAKKSYFKISGIYTILSSLFKLRSAIKYYKPRIVLSFICPSNLKTIIAASFIDNVKIVISERNNPDRQDFPFYIKQGRKLLYKFADVITANSPGAIKSLKKYVPENKLKYVPNPVCMPVSRNFHLNDKGNFNILYVGRLVQQKRVKELLQAFILLKKKLNNVTLTFVGDGPQRSELQIIVNDNSLNEFVKFVGHVSDVDKYYTSADLFALISKYEGMPNVLLEAMSHGVCCVVSSEVNETAELIADYENGFIIKDCSVEKISEKLYEVIINKKIRDKIVRNARESIKNHSIENVLKQWSDALEI